MRAKIDPYLSLVEQEGLTSFSGRQQHTSNAVATVRRDLGVNLAFSREPAHKQPNIKLVAPLYGWSEKPEAVNHEVERHASEASVSFAGNLTDDPELRHTEGGIARAMFRVAVSGRREQEPSFFTVIVWRDQAEHAAQSLAKGSGVVVLPRLQQRAWTAENGSAHSVVEVVAEELGPSLRWATARPERASRSAGE